MTQWSKIEYPRCPYCLILINDMKIFSLHDIASPYFHLKTCPNPKCGKPFLMKTRTELTTETVPVEDY